MKLPDPDGDFAEISRYGHTIDGYGVLSVDQGIDLLRLLHLESRVGSLGEVDSRRLRLGLFFALRAMHWEYVSGYSEEEVLAREIVRHLRGRIEAGGDHTRVWIPPCPLCHSAGSDHLMTSDHSAVVEDRFPVAEGHVLVVPAAHGTSLFELPGDQYQDLWNLVKRARDHLREETGCTDFTIGVNDGELAGQSLPHAHIHIIPRRPADVPDPSGGIRWVLPDGASRWSSKKKNPK